MNVKVKRYAINTIMTLSLPVIVMALFAIITGGRSLSTRMLLVTMRQSITPIILSMALIGNMRLGMFDFSAGGVLIAASIIGANLMKITDTGIVGLVFFCMMVSIALTALTGFLNNKLRVPIFVLTIGLVFIYEMLPRLLFHGGATISVNYTILASSPYIFIVFAVVFVAFYLLHNKTAYGHNIRALGGSQEIAESAGLNAPRIKLIGFIISGVFLGVASVLHMSSSGQLMNVQALGSVETIFGALMGVFLAFFLSRYCNLAIAVVVGTFTMTTLTNGFVAVGLPQTMRTITTGLFLLVLLCISANQGRFKQWIADRERAREANIKYEAKTNTINM